MDMPSIGHFIAELRKQKGLTQEQLGTEIGVTNKTVSRWETGTYMPPADALLKMSGLFGVSVNEILSGRRLSEPEYREAAEENLKQIIRSGSFSRKDKIGYFKKKWLKDHVAVMVLTGVCIVAVLVVGLLRKNSLMVSFVPLLIAVAHGWRNNAMMTYAERHVYDDAGDKP